MATAVVLAFVAGRVTSGSLAGRDVADGADVQIAPAGRYVLTQQGVELPFAIVNRGGDVRVGAPTAETAELALLPGAMVGPLGAGERETFVVRLQAECRTLRHSLGRDARVLVPVTSASGRTRMLPVPLEAALLRRLADQACGLGSVTELVAVRAVGPVRTTAQGVQFWIVARNTSPREAELAALTAPGLRLAVNEELPRWLGAGLTTTVRVTLSVTSCRQAPRGAAELVAELSDPRGGSSQLPVDLGSRTPVHATWLSYIARSCPAS